MFKILILPLARCANPSARLQHSSPPLPSQNTSAYPFSLEQNWQEKGSLGCLVPQHGCWSKGIFSQKPCVKSLILVLNFCIPPPIVEDFSIILKGYCKTVNVALYRCCEKTRWFLSILTFSFYSGNTYARAAWKKDLQSPLGSVILTPSLP